MQPWWSRPWERCCTHRDIKRCPSLRIAGPHGRGSVLAIRGACDSQPRRLSCLSWPHRKRRRCEWNLPPSEEMLHFCSVMLSLLSRATEDSLRAFSANLFVPGHLRNVRARDEPRRPSCSDAVAVPGHALRLLLPTSQASPCAGAPLGPVPHIDLRRGWMPFRVHRWKSGARARLCRGDASQSARLTFMQSTDSSCEAPNVEDQAQPVVSAS